MTESQVPAAGRVCKCGAAMQRSSEPARWYCPACRRLSDRDPYLESVQDGAPTLPGLERMDDGTDRR